MLQPREAKQECQRHADTSGWHGVLLREEMQQGQCEQACHQGETKWYRQKSHEARLPVTNPGESCEQDAEEQARDESAGAKIVCQDADDQDAGVGQRAGERGQEQ